MLRILQLKTSANRGGAETICLDATVEMRDRGVEVVTIVGEDGWLVREMRKRSLEVHVARFGFMGILGIARARRPDVFFIHGARMNAVGVIVGKMLGIPVVAVEHSVGKVGSTTGIRNAIDRILGLGNARRIAVSDAVARMQVDQKLVGAEKVTIVPNGIRLSKSVERTTDRGRLRRSLGLPEEATLLISVGRLDEAKGQVYLLRALAGVSAPGSDLRLIILGDGPLRNELAGEAERLGILQRVDLRGGVDNVGEFLDASDIFVLPSLWEGLPMAMLEAMNAGLPVVATGVGGIPEVLSHEANGLLCRPADVEDLRRAITRLLESPELCRKLGDAGRGLVRERHSLEAMVDGHLAVLQQVVAGTGRKASLNLTAPR